MVDGIPIDIEVGRVMNLVRGFGWEKREQRLDGDKVVIVIEKKVTPPDVGVPA